MRSGLGGLANADEQQAFGGEAGGGVEEEGLVGSCLEFTGGQGGGSGGGHAGVAGEQGGLGVAAFFCLRVAGCDDEEFDVERCQIGKNQVSLHVDYCFTLGLRFASGRGFLRCGMGEKQIPLRE